MRVKLCGKPSQSAKRDMNNDMLSAETAADYDLRDGFLSIAVSDGKHATALGVAVRRRLCLVLGFRFRRRAARRTGRHVAARAGAAPLHLAGLRAASARCRKGFGDLGGLGWRRGIAMTLFGGLPLALWSYIGYVLCPARPRQHHSAVVRRCRRTSAGAFHSQGSVAAAPHRRRAEHRPRPWRDRRRGIAHDGRARAVLAICCSSPREAHSRFSACCCGCGGLRRCMRPR